MPLFRGFIDPGNLALEHRVLGKSSVSPIFDKDLAVFWLES
jgi:hypothetical protein